MADPDKTVFLSYRRDVSGPLAHLVRNDLVAHGFDVFMDVGSLGGGEFEPVILREIEARTHFLVLLEPGSLDRIGEQGDWLRREIAHALTHRRNVVPLLADGAPDAHVPPTCPPGPWREYLDAAWRSFATVAHRPTVLRPPRRCRSCCGTIGPAPYRARPPVLAHLRGFRPLPSASHGPQWTAPRL